ncbi:MAG: TetR/AcrR family transcriptional regulator [Acidimicrobiia bacterium]
MARYRAGLLTRDRILDSTRWLLARAGLDGTTMAAILDRAKVRSGSFYNLFDSKNEAILTVVREAITAVDPHPDGVGQDTVEELVTAYVEFFIGQPTLARIYMQLAVGGALNDEDVAGRVIHHHRDRLERFTDAIRRTRDTTPAKAQLEAELLLAGLNGLALRWLLDPDFDMKRRAREILKRWKVSQPQ